jgi:glucoamylase
MEQQVLFDDHGSAGFHSGVNSSGTNTSLTGFIVVEPIMHAVSSLLLLGTLVFQSVLGRPDATRVRREGEILKRSVDSFVATESPIALSRLLCNIGSTGCYASGASSGIVIASPSKNNPDCKCFDWVGTCRDASL